MGVGVIIERKRKSDDRGYCVRLWPGEVCLSNEDFFLVFFWLLESFVRMGITACIQGRRRRWIFRLDYRSLCL